MSAAAPTIASALRTLDRETKGLAALSRALNDGLGAPFAQAVTRIATTRGRTIVTGMGKSGLVGRKIAATLASTGTPAHYVHPGEASHGDLGMITPDDVVLALSWSGETAELADIISYSRRFGVGLIALTSASDSTLAREADIALVLPKATEACPNGLAPTTSTTMQMALGDALAVALLEARGFTPEEFRQFHPGGKLGARLTYVRQVMHVGAAVPIVAAGTLMAEAILVMTARGFGCVGVTDTTGALIGIVTDGDLRRHMRPDLTTLPVDQVMSRAPRTISGDDLAVEALEMLNRNRITAVLVVDGAGRPEGILHLHDLLRLGVA
ncbi:MAG TPA: KpsF/GutQ family sugar-phosphate isomerase [Beijerinckiaceae bacterium]|nr:KpsF/GutQ family sugar-phosphate isomerase [Beijerinckiaceae bacterium]